MLTVYVYIYIHKHTNTYIHSKTNADPPVLNNVTKSNSDVTCTSAGLFSWDKDILLSLFLSILPLLPLVPLFAIFNACSFLDSCNLSYAFSASSCLKNKGISSPSFLENAKFATRNKGTSLSPCVDLHVDEVCSILYTRNIKKNSDNDPYVHIY